MIYKNSNHCRSSPSRTGERISKAGPAAKVTGPQGAALTLAPAHSPARNLAANRRAETRPATGCTARSLATTARLASTRGLVWG